MTLGLAFWVVMLIAIIFGGFGYSRPAWEPRIFFGFGLFVFLLLFLLGWQVFGFILQGPGAPVR